jgi:type II secretory ATPase GspE/PulE/Tfp pilus assembly ATPase PilB-like protein
MLNTDFVTHLARKGALRDAGPLDGALLARRRDGKGNLDWVGSTKLTQPVFADELAAFYRCPRVQRSELTGNRFAGALLSRRFLREGRLFPFEDASGVLTLAVAVPVDDETLRALTIALQPPLKIVVATLDDIDAALGATLESEPLNSVAPAEPTSAKDNLDDLRDLARGGPVVRALDDLLRLAVEQRATDLHIEPFADALQVRLRVDGLLKFVSTPPMSMAKGLLSRLKIMAGLNITERRLPQDGRARIIVSGAEIDLRVATMPTMNGESAVIRLLRDPAIGLTFASALRAFLRQDPDVIMVGEMRDAETAHIGVHAALTGHLVLTTLHTNTAAGAITRLIDMGVESFLLASCVRAILGQRLVRLLCEHCKRPHRLSAADIAADHRYAALGFAAGDLVHEPVGCEWCDATGFRGRQGVFEIMTIDADLRRAIGPKCDATDLEAVARRQGMTTMIEDGIAKCRAGLTTLGDVFRVAMSL